MSDSRSWFGFSPAVLMAAVALVLVGGWFVFAHTSSGSHRAEIAGVCNAAKSAAAVQRAKKPPLSVPLAQTPADTSIFADISATAQARLTSLQALSFTGAAATQKDQLVAGEQRILGMAQEAQGRFVAAGGFANLTAMNAGEAVRPIVAEQTTQRALYRSAFDVDCFI